MSVTYNGSPQALLTYSGPANRGKMVRFADGVWRFAAHNVFLNSAAPVTQNITTVVGATYSVAVLAGSGSIVCSAGGSGTATFGTPATFTATTTTLTCTVSGTVTKALVRRTPSDAAYIATVGSAKFGLPYHWDKNGVSLGIWHEHAATNSLTYSADLSNAAWSKTNITLTAGQTDPAGTSTAFKVEATASAATNIYNSGTVTGTSATGSVMVKKGSGATDANGFSLYNATLAATIVGGTLNYDTGAFTYTTGSSGVTVTDCGSGWWLIEMAGAITSGNSIRLYCGFAGASETAAEFNYAWLPQIEAGNIGSSRIPTYVATVTRANDVLTLDTTAFPYSTTEGTVIIEGTNRRLPTYAHTYMWRLVNGDFTDGAGVYATNNTGAVLGITTDESVTTSAPASGLTLDLDDEAFKAAFGWKLNDFGISANGAAVVTDVSGAVPNECTTLRISSSGSTTSTYFIKKLTYLPRKMTSAELVTASTP